MYEISRTTMLRGLQAAKVVAKKNEGRALLVSDGSEIYLTVPHEMQRVDRRDLCVCTQIHEVSASGDKFPTGTWWIDVPRALGVLSALEAVPSELGLTIHAGRVSFQCSLGTVEIGTLVERKGAASVLPRDRVPDSVKAWTFTNTDMAQICPLYTMSAPWTGAHPSDRLSCVEVVNVYGAMFAAASDGVRAVMVELIDVQRIDAGAPLWLHRSVMKHMAATSFPGCIVRRGESFTRLDCGDTSWAWQHGQSFDPVDVFRQLRRPLVATMHASDALLAALYVARECLRGGNASDHSGKAVVIRSDGPHRVRITTSGASSPRMLYMVVDAIVVGEFDAFAIDPDMLLDTLTQTQATMIEIAGPLNAVFMTNHHGRTGVVMPMRI